MSKLLLKQPSDDITTFKLVDPPKAKSAEWKYFKQYSAICDRSKTYAVCLLCKENEINESEKKKRKINYENYEVKYEQSTSKLTRHLKHKHKEVYQEVSDRKASKLMGSGGEPFFKNRTISNDKFYKFMIMTYQPSSIVENEYFRDWIDSMSEDYKHISCTGVKKTYSVLAAEMKEQLKEKLKGKFVAVTGEKCSIGHQDYLGLTAHFIDDNWNIQSFTLSCATTDSAGSTVIEHVDDFMKVINDYEIPHDFISAIVTDAEPTMNAFGKRMSENFNVAWIGCIDHTIELSIGKAFDDSKYPENLGCMKAARKLVGTFRHSNQKMEQLIQYQEDASKNIELSFGERRPIPIIPVEDCITRWWSTYSMLEQLCALKKHIVMMENVKSIDTNMSESQWNVASEIIKLLKPFMVVQELFEGENYVTISSVCILIENIRKKLDELRVSNSNEATAIVVQFIKKFQDAWGNGLDPANEHKTRGARQRINGFQPAHLIAAFIDPRSKSMHYFDDTAKAEIQIMVKKEAEALNIINMNSKPSNVFAQNSGTSIYEMLLGEIEDDHLETPISVDIEIHKYLSRKRLSYHSTTSDGERRMNNPLDWWRINQQEYPLLSKLAKKYLCIPATSVPVQRLYSRAGLTVTEKRDRLPDDATADFIFLNANWDKLNFSVDRQSQDKEILNGDSEIPVIYLE